MSESYWRFVEPIWHTVSIYDGGEVFLQEFRKATEKQRHLYATHWAQSEIMNGGLGQFFSNSTGVLAPEAVEGFKAIGMPNCASSLLGAMELFGNEYPRDRDTRDQLLEDFFDKYGDEENPMDVYEVAIAEELEEESGGFEVAANNYANQG
ncbi:DMP19 family protein [Microbulbifer marinus]|nr:DUF4375 domain-containing protein [Microbulbifer marinus]